MFRASIRRLLTLDDPPERTALAFALGVFIAFSPFLGLHTIMATLAAFVFRFNKVAIFSGTFINNPPLTLVPIIIASYATGALLLGRPLRISQEGIDLLKDPHLLTADYYRKLGREGWQVVWPFTLGGMVLSVVCSLVAYPVTFWLLQKRAAKKVKSNNG